MSRRLLTRNGLSICAPALLAVCGAVCGAVACADPPCTALADAATGRVLRREGVCDQRVTPASTFKIALALMGYDSGYLTDEHLPALPFREGYADWMPSWRATTDPSTWIRNSVVWYSQRLSEWLGEARLQHYVEAFDYGNKDLSGDPGTSNGLTRAWLSSSLRISPLEQLAFLHRIIARELPVSARAYDMTNRITLVGVLPNGWEVHGKSGNGSQVNTDGSPDRTRQIGWFVGWASRAKRTLVFARCIQDDGPASESAAVRAREGMMRELPGILDSL